MDDQDEEAIGLLERIGLSSHEGRVYLALLREGVATPYRIAKQTGIPTGKIYEVFQRLDHRGFVAEVKGEDGGYVAKAPELVLSEIGDSYRATIAAASESLKKLKASRRHDVAWNVHGEEEVIACGRRIVRSATTRLAIAAPTALVDSWLADSSLAGSVNVQILCAATPAMMRPDWKWQRLTPANSTKVLRSGAVMTADGGIAFFAATDSEGGSYHGSWTESAAIIAMAEDYVSSLVFIEDVFDSQWIPWSES